MANFLQKFFPPAPPVSIDPGSSKDNLPSAYSRDRRITDGQPQMVAGLPNATIVYSIAASIMFVLAIYSLLTGAWFTALLVLLVAGCLMGYALFFLRNH